MITYGSVCSGIEAATVAWHPLGWRAAWLAQFDPEHNYKHGPDFPSAVLAHHYPDVPNLGDMTRIEDMIIYGDLHAPDLLTGGTPCQAFSVAGLRKGLDDARGQITLSFCRLADAIDAARYVDGRLPSVIVWENVPGVLSDKSNAFGCFLAGLAGEDGELQAPGGKWANAGCVFGPSRTVAWRTLDAQYFGVAQRRRRVWVVASARKGFDPCAVLFESEGVRRDTAPSRETGQGFTHDAEGGVGVGCYAPECVAALRARDFKGPPQDVSEPAYVTCVTGDRTHELKAEGADGSEDGAGRGTPIVAFDTTQITSAANYSNPQPGDPCHPLAAGAHPPCVAFHAQAQADQLPTDSRDTGISDSLTVGQRAAVAIAPLTLKGINLQSWHASTQEANARTLLSALREAVGEEAFTEWGLGILVSFLPPEVLRKAVHGRGVRCTTVDEFGLVYYALSCPQDSAERAVLQVWGNERHGRPPSGWQPHEQRSIQLGAYLSSLSQPGASAETVLYDLWQASEGPGILQQTLFAIQEARRSNDCEGKPKPTGMQVRRLVPVECEFLMGFPRNYTQIPWRKKGVEDCPDGPRYKALGNSWAVPCAAWIGRRIAASLAMSNTGNARPA